MLTRKEIRLENFSDIEKIIEEEKVTSSDKNDYFSKSFILIGIDAIKKFENTYNFKISEHDWKWADERVENLKINGSAKFVYIYEITAYADCRECFGEKYKTPNFSDGHLSKVVEYKNYLMTTGCSFGCKTYRFYLFNDLQDTSLVETEYPQKVGTLTDKKADAWLNCLIYEKKRALETDNANIEKVKQFKKKLADITERPLDDFYSDRGTIYMGIFGIHWTCDVKTGYTGVGFGFEKSAKGKNGETLTTFDRIKIIKDAGLLK